MAAARKKMWKNTATGCLKFKFKKKEVKNKVQDGSGRVGCETVIIHSIKYNKKPFVLCSGSYPRTHSAPSVLWPQKLDTHMIIDMERMFIKLILSK